MLCVGMQLRCSASIITGGRTSKMAFPVWRLGTRNEENEEDGIPSLETGNERIMLFIGILNRSRIKINFVLLFYPIRDNYSPFP
jgi:hypothetical protein